MKFSHILTSPQSSFIGEGANTVFEVSPVMGRFRGGLKRRFRGGLLLVLFAFLTSLLPSCSDELDIPGNNILGDNIYNVIISIPESEEVTLTKATEEGTGNENTITNLSLIFFGKDGKYLKTESLSLSTLNGTTISTTLTLEGETKDASKVYVVANANEVLSDLTVGSSTLEDVKAKAITTALSTTAPETGFPMTGEAVINKTNKTLTAGISRIVAKVSITADASVTGYTLHSFAIAKANKGAQLGTTTTDRSLDYKYYTGNGTETKWCINALSGYFYPTESYGTDRKDGAFLILMAKNAEQENCWYRLNLHNDKEKINLEANHVYNIEITSITGNGHPSYQEAMDYVDGDETKDIDYVIHDHAAKVLSMVSDGIRELGVTNDFVWDETTQSTTITVKWFSHNPGEDQNEPNLELVAGDEWLTLNKTGVSIEDVESEISGTHNGDTDNPGKRKNYTLQLKDKDLYTGPAKIKVTWLGLSREIMISMDQAAKHEALCNVKLKIYEGSTSKTEIEDYWGFLAGKDNSPKLYGVSEEQMGKDKARNDGFHFAMPYIGRGSSSDTKWTYEYTINFNSSVYEEGTKITSVTSDDELVKLETPIGEEGVDEVTISYNQGDNYLYQISEVVFTLTDKDNKSHTHSFPVYHTGFFYEHEDSDGINWAGNAMDAGFYYYEVVPVNASGTEKFMLDRNLGAKSNGMYIEDGSNKSLLGDPDSAGAYFIVANPGDNTAIDKLKPTMKSGVCPKGYHIPSKTEWDNVKNSSSFSMHQRTASSGTKYFTSEMQSTNEDVGTIYFPKGRYFNGGNKVGQTATGYYWTATGAEGLEKEQIGKWLKVLTLNGSSASYINGEIPYSTTNGTAEGYKVPVRCFLGDEAEPDVKHTISFNVRGATHVFLYTKDSENPTPLFAFPGKYVTGAEGAKKWVYFSYNSSSEISELKVLFAKMESDGKIILFEKDLDRPYTYISSEESGSYNVESAMKTTGWEVKQGWYYDFLNEPDSYNESEPNVTQTVEQERIIYRLYWGASTGFLYVEDFGINGNTPYQYSDLQSNGSRKWNGTNYYMEFEGDDYTNRNFKAEMMWTDSDTKVKKEFQINSSTFKDYSAGSTTYKVTTLGFIDGYVGSLSPSLPSSQKLISTNQMIFINFSPTVTGEYKYIKIWTDNTSKPSSFDTISSKTGSKSYVGTDSYIVFYQLSTDAGGSKVSSVKHLTVEEGTQDGSSNWNFTVNSL